MYLCIAGFLFLCHQPFHHQLILVHSIIGPFEYISCGQIHIFLINGDSPAMDIFPSGPAYLLPIIAKLPGTVQQLIIMFVIPFSNIATNSSPPIRYTGLRLNTLQINLQDSIIRISPKSCPMVSLTCLRLLTSKTTMANSGLPVRVFSSSLAMVSWWPFILNAG